MLRFDTKMFDVKFFIKAAVGMINGLLDYDSFKKEEESKEESK